MSEKNKKGFRVSETLSLSPGFFIVSKLRGRFDFKIGSDIILDTAFCEFLYCLPEWLGRLVWASLKKNLLN